MHDCGECLSYFFTSEVHIASTMHTTDAYQRILDQNGYASSNVKQVWEFIDSVVEAMGRLKK